MSLCCLSAVRMAGCEAVLLLVGIFTSVLYNISDILIKLIDKVEMEENWENMLEQDISAIKITKVDDDNIITTKPTDSLSKAVSKPSKPSLAKTEDLSTKENIFKGLTM